jgi:hypothetical protein
MSNWNRRELLHLADAIRNSFKTGVEFEPKHARMTQILHEADQGSKTVFTHNQRLHDVRCALCHVCRSEQLATCDRDEGWSPNCAFVRTHTAV